MQEKRTVWKDGEEISYFFEKKKVKNFNLRVKKDASICVSAPFAAKEKTVDDFVLKHIDFIRSARARLACLPKPAPLCDGGGVYYLGERYRLKTVYGAKVSVSFDAGVACLVISSRTKDIARAYSRACAARFLSLICERCRALEQRYPHLRGRAKEIRVRHMTSMWGNCRAKSGTLTFSLMLSAMPLPLIDGVIAHEYTHFAHSDHGKGFYEALAQICPDYKEKRRALSRVKREQEAANV